jgi:hypothetical protein
LQELFDFVYPNLLQDLTNYKFFERAILSLALENVEKVNEMILSFILGNENVYLSSDSACDSNEGGEGGDLQAEWFTNEFLNDVKVSGISNHKIVLKLGVPVMLLRNIDQ